eukprot:COSAG02_NODE_5960_length_3909_cov_2.654331_2_plen_131_part_00
MHVPSDFYSRDYLKTMSISRNPTTGLPMKNVAILRNTRTTFTNSTCSAAANFAHEYGMEVVFNEPFDPTTMDSTQYQALTLLQLRSRFGDLLCEGTLLEFSVMRFLGPKQESIDGYRNRCWTGILTGEFL